MSYEVFFTGQLRDGFSRRQGVDALCHQFKLNFDQVKYLLSGARHVVKRVEERRQAERIVKALWKGGWHSELHLHSRVVFCTRGKMRRAKPNAEPAFVRLFSADSTVSVGVPESWQPCDGLNPCAVLQAGNRDSHHYLVILKQARRELPPALTLLEYGAAQLQQCVAQVAAGEQLSAPASIGHGQGAACVSEMSAWLAGLPIQYLVAHFQCEQSFYTAFLWCARRDYQTQKPVFDRIVSSLRMEVAVEKAID